VLLNNKMVRVVTILGLCVFMAGGCAEKAKKPAPSPTPRPSVETPTPAKKPVSSMMTTQEAKRVADRLAKDAVKVEGVDKAAVVIDTTGPRPNAYVGLNLKPEVKGEETNRVKMEVERKLKAAEPRLHSVNVTSDPDLVKRIRDIAMGIGQGKPISSFAAELRELGRRLTPTTR